MNSKSGERISSQTLFWLVFMSKVCIKQKINWLWTAVWFVFQQSIRNPPILTSIFVGWTILLPSLVSLVTPLPLGRSNTIPLDSYQVCCNSKETEPKYNPPFRNRFSLDYEQYLVKELVRRKCPIYSITRQCLHRVRILFRHSGSPDPSLKEHVTMAVSNWDPVLFIAAWQMTILLISNPVRLVLLHFLLEWQVPLQTMSMMVSIIVSRLSISLTKW